MLATVRGYGGLERLFEEASRGCGGQHYGQRRARQAHLAGKVVASSNQQGPAPLHVVRDVFVVLQLQDVPVLVAVEDDEIEATDHVREQLARRKGDERQLIDRCSVQLLQGPKDGEVDEVDRGVGAQQVTPSALARVRFARHQQHEQVFAHALRDDDGTVVDERQLTGCPFGFDLDNVLARVRKVHLCPGDGPERHAADLVGTAFAPDADLGHLPGVWQATLLDDAELNAAILAGAFRPLAFAVLLFLADDAVAWRLEDLDAAIVFARMTGQQCMHGGIKSQRARRLRHVVYLAVRYHDDTGKPIGRRVRQRAVEIGEQIGTGGLLARWLRRTHPAHLQV